MVTRAEKFKDGGKIAGTILLREPQNGSPRVFSQLGSENNGASQAAKEEKGSINGFQVVGMGEDGVKRDKVKPLSTLDSNKAFKKSCSPHVKHSSLKVVLAATKGQNVQEKANVTWMKENKENLEDAPPNNPFLQKKVKQMRSGCGNHSDGSNEDYSKLSKRKRNVIRDSVCQNGADTMKCQDESKLLLFSQSINEKSTSSDTTNMQNFPNPCHSMTWYESAQDFSSTTHTASILTSLDDNQRSSDFMLNEVNALPLFKASDSLKYPEEVSPKGNDNGLSILGAAVFLSLGLDEIPCKSAVQLELSHAWIDSSKNVSKGHAPYIGTDKCCSSTNYSTSCKIVKQPSPNLGADLTLGLSTELVKELPGDYNNANFNNEAVFPIDEFPEFKKIPHHKVDIKHSVTETVLETNEIPSMNKLLQNQDETDDILAVSQVLEPDNIDTYLEKNEEIGKQELAQSQLESETSICCLNTDLLIPDDGLDYKNAGKKELVNQMGTGKHYMHFSDLSMPLRGTLLLPRGQKRARRYPIQVKRYKHEPLKQKKEGDKKEQVSKFSRVSPPSGLLAELNPGIISHVRNSKQVHAILEAVVGSDALTAYQDSREIFCPAPKTKAEEKIPGTNYTIVDVFENGDSEIMDMHHAASDALEARDEHQSSEVAHRKLEERLISDSYASDHLFDIEERPTDANLNEEGFEHLAAREDSVPPVEYNKDLFYSKQTAGEQCNLQETSNCHCHYCRPNDSSSMDLTCSASLSMKAATVASHWLELHYQDIKGRLAALKRSRKRVRAKIKEVIGYTSLDHMSATRKISELFVQASSGDQHANMLADAEHDHMEKWRSLFSHMDHSLNAEGAKLEASLQRIKEMQAHCKWGLEEFQGITSDCPQQQRPESLGDEFRSKVASAKIIERRFAVEAAAASIYSTANFVTTEDVSCF